MSRDQSVTRLQRRLWGLKCSSCFRLCRDDQWPKLRAAVPALHAGGAALPPDEALSVPGGPRAPEEEPALTGPAPSQAPTQAAVQIRPG